MALLLMLQLMPLYHAYHIPFIRGSLDEYIKNNRPSCRLNPTDTVLSYKDDISVGREKTRTLMVQAVRTRGKSRNVVRVISIGAIPCGTWQAIGLNIRVTILTHLH